MKFFDCNCSYGHSSRPAFRYARNAGELVDEMNFCGIDKALVYHTGMRFGSPLVWNSKLREEIEGFPNLEPTWAILPSQTGEQPDADKFISMMQTIGVKALRAFPQEHRYSLDGNTFGKLLEILAEKRIPLLVKHSLLEIGRLLEDFPNLTLVAMNQGPHSLERYLRPLVEKFPNLYIDTSYYIVDGLIEDFCARYGHGRLLFGSGYPDNCSGAALLRLARADIDDTARLAIAAGNLEKLLEGARL